MRLSSITALFAAAIAGAAAKPSPLRRGTRAALRLIPRGGAGDAVAHPTSLAELTLLSERPGVVVVDFSASWCGPCQKIGPVFAKLAEDVPAALFVKVDVDEVGDASAHFGVAALPTFIVFEDGVEKTRFQGADEASLRQALDDRGCPPPRNDIF